MHYVNLKRGWRAVHDRYEFSICNCFACLPNSLSYCLTMNPSALNPLWHVANMTISKKNKLTIISAFSSLRQNLKKCEHVVYPWQQTQCILWASVLYVFLWMAFPAQLTSVHSGRTTWVLLFESEVFRDLNIIDMLLASCRVWMS